MNVEFKFANIPQREFYYCTARNQLFSGGFQNGKTFIACMKAFNLLVTFPGYRMAIGRQTFQDLKKTTMETFFQIVPKELIVSHNNQEGITILRGDSKIYWVHLDKMDESTAKGLEVNSILIDQSEETEEKTIEVVDARLGRWSGATVPQYLLDKYPNWPINAFGKPDVPSYFMQLCNPEDEAHHLFRHYHPDSMERREGYAYIEGQWDVNLGSRETYEQALLKDQEWVNKKVYGKWGSSGASIHYLSSTSLLDYDEDLIVEIKKSCPLFRAMDHGFAAPTCCLWFAIYKGVFICYREYYVPGKTISYHRAAISELSGTEEYQGNFADPHLWDKVSEREGGLCTTASEYYTTAYKVPPIHWEKADNNEFTTRNRIDELFAPNKEFAHPVTQIRPSPGMYFIKACPEYKYGCKEVIQQTMRQRKKLLGSVNGKNIYSDARDDRIMDHAYDPLRYFISKRGMNIFTKTPVTRKIPRNTMAYFEHIRQRDLFRKASINVPNSY